MAFDRQPPASHKQILLRLSGLPCTLVLIFAFSRVALGSELTLVPKVDRRVELLSILFRLAGNPEYSMSPLKNYTADIDSYFSPYKGHPAALLARKLANERGVSFDAVMSMAVHISPPPELSPLVEFTDAVPDSRFGRKDALLLARVLNDFYRDTHFERFFAAHQHLYQLAEDRFRTVLGDLDLNWYKRFYGEVPRGHFNLILGMNNGGGNYGPRAVFPDGHEELFSIIGAGGSDKSGNPAFDGDYLGLIIHEFNHSFVNPAVAERWSEFAGADEVYKSVADQMQAMAYGNSEVMVQESLVRAAVILYFESRGHSSRDIQRRIIRERANSFLWMDELCSLLRKYTSQRGRYPTFDAFMPAVVQFYRGLPPRLGEIRANFDKYCVHVTGIQPFPNHSEGVDPAQRELIITFDKPLDPAHYSINYGAGGEEHWPITGSPEYLPGNQSIELRLALKPGWQYSFVLTGLSFASPDGFPLEAYTVEFKTKP